MENLKKKERRQFFALFMVFLLPIIIAIDSFLLLYLYNTSDHLFYTPEYYADKDNYITIDCEYRGDFHYSLSESVVLDFTFYDEDSHRGQTIYYWASKSNKEVLENNGFPDVQAYEQVTIYVNQNHPDDENDIGWRWRYDRLVGIKTEDKIYLDFETGVANQVQDEKEELKEFYKSLAIFGGIEIVSVSIFVVSIVYLIKSGKKYKEKQNAVQ